MFYVSLHNYSVEQCEQIPLNCLYRLHVIKLKSPVICTIKKQYAFSLPSSQRIMHIVKHLNRVSSQLYDRVLGYYVPLAWRKDFKYFISFTLMMKYVLLFFLTFVILFLCSYLRKMR